MGGAVPGPRPLRCRPGPCVAGPGADPYPDTRRSRPHALDSTCPHAGNAPVQSQGRTRAHPPTTQAGHC
eukprot:5417162-Prymnesium_polylepis.1